MVFSFRHVSCHRGEKARDGTVIMIFHRTDLRKGASKAKFHSESDFDVRLAVDRPKPGQFCKKTDFPVQSFRRKQNFGVETRNVGDRPKRVLAKFRADRSLVRGVNGCSWSTRLS